MQYACSIYLALGRKYDVIFLECFWSLSNSRNIFRFRFWEPDVYTLLLERSLMVSKLYNSNSRMFTDTIQIKDTRGTRKVRCAKRQLMIVLLGFLHVKNNS